MTLDFREVIPIVTAVECIVGAAVGQIGRGRPSWLPAPIRAWIPPWPERNASLGFRLLGQSVGWMILIALTSVLLIPLAPAYAAFRGIDAFHRGTYALGFRGEKLWPG